MSWDIDFGRGVEVSGGPEWAMGGGVNDSLHIEIQLSPDDSVFVSPGSGLISPDATIKVTVWIVASFVDPPRFHTVTFILPGQEREKYASPYVK